MTEVDQAYIAGFLDGDGSIMAHIEPHRECRYGHRIRVVVKFSQHEDGAKVLDDIQRILGTGYVSHSNKRVRELSIKSARQVERLLRAIKPYVRVKRTQVNRALELLDRLKRVRTAEDFETAAELADAVSNSNLKSRSRRRHFSHTITLVPVTTDPPPAIPISGRAGARVRF